MRVEIKIIGNDGGLIFQCGSDALEGLNWLPQEGHRIDSFHPVREGNLSLLGFEYTPHVMHHGVPLSIAEALGYKQGEKF